MEKKKSEKKVESRIPTPEELWQDCPKCDGDLLVRNYSKRGIDYKCSNPKCKHEEFREWDSKEASEKPVEKVEESKKKD